MSADEKLRLAPALLLQTGAPHDLSRGSLVDAGERRPRTALVLTPLFGLKTSSRPLKSPPFVIRLPSPPSLVSFDW